jgi:hypothetical protein
MSGNAELNNNFGVIRIAVIVTIIIGIIIAVFFMVVNKESYSSMYIVPGSIIHNTENNSVSFTYGVRSFETGIMDYSLDTYIDTTLTKSKQFSLKPNEILDERSQFILPLDARYPLKVSLKLTTKTSTEEVHFWLT